VQCCFRQQQPSAGAPSAPTTAGGANRVERLSCCLGQIYVYVYIHIVSVTFSPILFVGSNSHPPVHPLHKLQAAAPTAWRVVPVEAVGAPEPRSSRPWAHRCMSISIIDLSLSVSLSIYIYIYVYIYIYMYMARRAGGGGGERARATQFTLVGSQVHIGILTHTHIYIYICKYIYIYIYV